MPEIEEPKVCAVEMYPILRAFHDYIVAKTNAEVGENFKIAVNDRVDSGKSPIRCRGRSSMNIDMSLTWSDTPQGHSYWSHVNKSVGEFRIPDDLLDTPNPTELMMTVPAPTATGVYYA